MFAYSHDGPIYKSLNMAAKDGNYGDMKSYIQAVSKGLKNYGASLKYTKYNRMLYRGLMEDVNCNGIQYQKFQIKYWPSFTSTSKSEASRPGTVD